MGVPKALLPIGEDVFLTLILNVLESIRLPDPIVVLGKHVSLVRPVIKGRSVRIVVNADPSAGQLSSVKLALMELDSSGPGCMLWPVDQPVVSAELVRGLLRLFHDSDAPLVMPRCGERKGHPAIFGRELFEEMMEVPLHEGLKKLVMRHMDRAAILPTEESAAIDDIDTPEDYFRLTGESVEVAMRRRAVRERSGRG